jgi:hypothetical protein
MAKHTHQGPKQLYPSETRKSWSIKKVILKKGKSISSNKPFPWIWRILFQSQKIAKKDTSIIIYLLINLWTLILLLKYEINYTLPYRKRVC